MTTHATVAAAHADDSLLRVAPVRHALADPHFKRIERPIDCRWEYLGLSDVAAGFNPLVHQAFHARTSVLSAWLENPATAPREESARAQLVKEVLRLAHDYLHSWCYRAIGSLDPSSGILQEPVTRANIDRFTYLHLLTEAAAVVGLDYWDLCVRDDHRGRGLGSLLRPQTVDYDERRASEFLHLNPGFKVQTSAFFFEVVKLFCRDEVGGFGLADLRKSPALSAWLRRELLASHSQRFVTRLWFSAFGGFRMSKAELYAPLRLPAGRMKTLACDLGELLWRKIKLEEELFIEALNQDSRWAYKVRRVPDFRVTNLFGVRPALYDWRSGPDPRGNFACYMKQHLSAFRLPSGLSLPEIAKLRGTLEDVHRTLDQASLWRLTERFERVGAVSEDRAPLEMIFVN